LFIWGLLGCVIDGVAYGDTSFNVVSVDDEIYPLYDFILEQNYPNPFNPSTILKYQIAQDELITLKVYDILGKEVATLVNEEQIQGSYEVSFNASSLSSGIYFYRLTSGSYIKTKTMMLMK
jgi:hypothetical protein